MPIEQLLARYGIARDGGGAAPPAAPAPGPGAARRAARGGRRGATAGAEADAAPRAESPEGDGVEGAERPAKRRRAEAGEAGGAPPPAAVLDAADAKPGACCRVKRGNAQCALATGSHTPTLPASASPSCSKVDAGGAHAMVTPWPLPVSGSPSHLLAHTLCACALQRRRRSRRGAPTRPKRMAGTTRRARAGIAAARTMRARWRKRRRRPPPTPTATGCVRRRPPAQPLPLPSPQAVHEVEDGAQHVRASRSMRASCTAGQHSMREPPTWHHARGAPGRRRWPTRSPRWRTRRTCRSRS